MTPMEHSLDLDNIKIHLIDGGDLTTDFPEFLPACRRHGKDTKEIFFDEIIYEGPAHVWNSTIYFRLANGTMAMLSLNFVKNEVEGSGRLYNGYYLDEKVLQLASYNILVDNGKTHKTYTGIIHYKGKGLVEHLNRLWLQLNVWEGEYC